MIDQQDDNDSIETNEANSGAKKLQTLVEIATDEDRPSSARISAANALLDRAWGRIPPRNTTRGNEDSKIRITSQMIEAGLDAAWNYNPRDWINSMDLIVQDIYREMEKNK